MKLSLTCRSCGRVLSAENEDDLVTLGQDHARDHGHSGSLSRDHVLARIRRHNPDPPETPRASRT